MTTSGAILLGVVVLILCGIALEYRLKRRTSYPLADRFARGPRDIELGMEATDVEKAAAVLRRNSALAAKTGVGGMSVSWIAVGASQQTLPTDDDRV